MRSAAREYGVAVQVGSRGKASVRCSDEVIYILPSDTPAKGVEGCLPIAGRPPVVDKEQRVPFQAQKRRPGVELDPLTITHTIPYGHTQVLS